MLILHYRLIACLVCYGLGGMVPAGCEMQNTLLDVTQSFLYEPRHIIAY